MTLPETLAAIAAELDRTGVERQALARRLRVSRQTLSRWFAGTRRPSGPATLALEAELGALRRTPSRRAPEPVAPGPRGRPRGRPRKNPVAPSPAAPIVTEEP